MTDRKDPRGSRDPREKRQKPEDEAGTTGRSGPSSPIPIPPPDSSRRIGREPAVDRDAIAAREAGIYDDPSQPPPRATDRPRERTRRRGRGRSEERSPATRSGPEPTHRRGPDSERRPAPEPKPRPEPRRRSRPAPEPEPAPEPGTAATADDWDIEEPVLPERKPRRPRSGRRAAPEESTPAPAPAAPEPAEAPAPEPEPEPEEDAFLEGIFEPEEPEEPKVEPEAELPEEPEVGPDADAEPAPGAEAGGPEAADGREAPPDAGPGAGPETPEPEAEAAPVAPPAPDGLDRWLAETYGPAIAERGERREAFRTSSGRILAPLYGPTAAAAREFDREVGYPGEFPFTRGIHATMYRGRTWTMRQYAGFASARATNERFRYLLSQGQTGLSVAFDLPTQIGYDSDDPWSAGEVGKVGVPINSLADMEALLDGIPLDQASLSMTINSTALILLLMVVAVAKKQGVDPANLRGTVQNDMLKEFAARNTYRFSLDAHLRLTTDLFRFSAKHLPKWNLISVSGYHMREAGCTAAQEVAFTLANGVAYVEKAVEAGLPIDDFAGRISFFFASHNHLLEEVAKFRAARRMWAKIMRDRFGAEDPRSQTLRFHTQTAGSTLTAKQPINNVVRVTIQALAAALGGTQSLHTNSWDEALGLPSQESALLALRTQQVIAHESGVADVVDPLGGSPLVEALTDAIEEDADALLAKIDELGGAVEAVRSGWMKGEIEASAYRAQKAIESGEQIVVGVNTHVMDEEMEPEVLSIDEEQVREVTEKLDRLRRERDDSAAEAALASLEISAAWGDADLPELVLACVESYCTIGEICRSLETVLAAGEEGA